MHLNIQSHFRGRRRRKGWAKGGLTGLNNIEEVEGWLLSFGTNATVVRPQALRQRLAKVGKEIARRYGEGVA
jgi:hypothetical protein